MKDKVLFFIARLLFGVPMGYFGTNDILTAKESVAAVPDYFPFPIIWVYIVGLSLLAASIGIIINQFSKWAYAGLSVLFLIFTLLVIYPHTKGGDYTDLMMHVALMGASFYMFLKEKR